MRITKTLVVIGILTTFALPVLAGAYTAGGTFVVKTQLGTVVDNGGVVCNGTQGGGVGGGCLLFPATGGREGFGGFVQVLDDAAGEAVAFQVCIDNNGDGICGGPASEADDRCFDQIYFSHDDSGTFFNPLGPLPTSFLVGCEGNGGFPGYVVLLCQGAHEVEGAAHTHSLTQGSIRLARDGNGYGDFCGGGSSNGTPSPGPIDLGRNPAVAKAYVVE